ncbi:hypothetical protein AHAS_Ahas19G0317000 [Arachis hypogaea]
MEKLANSIREPWCIEGDFNSILSLNDTGGSSNLSQDHKRFQSCINNCGVNDLGFTGPLFTCQRGNTKKRLDRFLCNLDFTNAFPNVSIRHLPKLKSDHLPILLDFHFTSSGRKEILFKLLTPWLLHKDYNNLVKNSWNKNGDLLINISSFVDKAKV